MQNEIEQLKIDKNSLQIALSTAELTISNLKEKEEEYQAEVSPLPPRCLFLGV